MTNLAAISATVAESLLRISFVVTSILSILHLLSDNGSHCTEDLGVLRVEGQWLLILSIAQVLSTVVFGVWKWALQRDEQAQ